MATKTLTVTEEAYGRLKAQKHQDESFSQVILRITHRRPLTEFVVILDPESGPALRRAVAESRRERLAADALRRRKR